MHGLIEVDERLRIDFDRREIWLEGKLVKLRPTEYRLLYHLVQNAGWVVSHDQLLQKVWGYEYRDEPHYVRLYVNYLRQKLEKDPSDPRYILTERGVGYRSSTFVETNGRLDQRAARRSAEAFPLPDSCSDHSLRLRFSNAGAVFFAHQIKPI